MPEAASKMGFSVCGSNLGDLLGTVRERTQLDAWAHEREEHNHVYFVGENMRLFYSELPDAYGERLFHGVVLAAWGPTTVEGREDLIPEDALFHDHQSLLYRCALAYLKSMPLALHGHTGIGKTEAVRYFAHILGAPLYRMNLHGLSTTDDIVGRLLPAGHGSVAFQDGLVTTAVRNGGILLLEEMNATGQEVWFALHGLLDGSRALVLVEKDNEVVRQHPHCRIYSTFNPAEYSSLYPGTKDLSAAYLRRWVSVRLGFPSAREERAILVERFPEYRQSVHSDTLDLMLEVAHVARRMLQDDTRAFDFVLSTAILVTWADLARDVGPIEAARLAFYDILDERCRAILRDHVFSYVTDWDYSQLVSNA
jgi:MoxR-like ATPase